MSAFVKDFGREHAVFYPPVTCFDMPLGNLTAPNSNHSFCARTATGTLLFSSHYIQQLMRWTRMHLYWGLTMTTFEICSKFWRCCDTVKINTVIQYISENINIFAVFTLTNLFSSPIHHQSDVTFSLNY